MTALASVSPADGTVVARYPETPPHEVARSLDRAAAAQRSWAGRPVAERAVTLHALADAFRSAADEAAHLMAVEMGKPHREGRAEVAKCAWACEHYADHGPGLLADEAVATEAARSFVAFEPLGTVLGIMPWNFPFWQVARFAVPSLLAGNAVVLKHAPNVSGCAMALQRIMRAAGVPAGLFSPLILPVERVGPLIADPRISAVTFTGSSRAGRIVAAQAAAHLKPSVLELGGSDPYVVLNDADLDVAVEACVTARLVNGGQSCIAGKRWIVVDAVRREFITRCVAAMADRVIGHPLDEATDIGPLAREDLRHNLARQVEQSIALGAEVLCGGEVPSGPGFYYPPTVLDGVRPGMPAHDQETFGPVAAVVAATDDATALALANRSAYGLGAAVFTADAQRGERIARSGVRAGSCYVNAFVHSDPRLPFGGTKASGYGRELGILGLRSFVNAKTIVVA